MPEIASMEAIETGYLWEGFGIDFRSADLVLTSLLQKSTPVVNAVIGCREGRFVLSGMSCYSPMVVQ